MAEHALDALNGPGDAVNRNPHALYLQGEALRTLERYQEALEPLERAAEVATDKTHVWLALGWCYKRTGQIDLAVGALQNALEIEPADALIHYNLACYLSLAGGKQRALEHLAHAVTIDSDYRSLAHEEPDFDPIRSDRQFQALTSIIV
jgi:Flp pilus assembly protein TadD